MRMVLYAIAIGSALAVSAPDSGPTMNLAWSSRMHFFAISAACAGFDWLFTTLYLTWCPRIPPVALRCLKNAVAPQLSVSPICAYTPDSARSPHTTIGDFADWPEDDEPHAAS